MRARVLAVLVLAGCNALLGIDQPGLGGGGGGGGDGGSPGSGGNPGFTTPTGVLQAWTFSGSGFTATTLDLSCLGLPESTQTTQVGVAVTAGVLDIGSGGRVAGAQVSMFDGNAIATPFDTEITDTSGNASITVPIGTNPAGVTVSGADLAPSFVFDIRLNPTDPTQDLGLIVASTAARTGLVADGGYTQSPSLATVIGALHDCSLHEVSGFVATVSTQPGSIAQAPGVETSYFSDATNKPVPTGDAPAAEENGSYVIANVPTGGSPVFVQVWGFPTQAALAADSLTHIAELAVIASPGAAIIAQQNPHDTAN